MKTIIKQNTWLTRDFTDFGWGNGYVLIPIGHKLHGKHYDDIDVDVHGGLTFSELVDIGMVERWTDELTNDDLGKWIVGFDTCHSGDTLLRWSKDAVQSESNSLMGNLLLIS